MNGTFSSHKLIVAAAPPTKGAMAMQFTAYMTAQCDATLLQVASSKTDPLEAAFETAVLNFIRADYRAAIQLFTEARKLADQRGRADMAGDCLRWLGHSHQKLQDYGKAAEHFAQGCVSAQLAGNRKLEVDCLNGMGCLYRGINDHERAVSSRRLFLGGWVGGRVSGHGCFLVKWLRLVVKT